MAERSAESEAPAKVFLLSFTTRAFDLSREPENPINPIPGQSFLAWLKPRLEGAGYGVTEPDAEDWGWYMDVEGPGGRYLIGASATPGEHGGADDWILQLHKHRGILDRLRGRNRLTRNEELLRTIERELAANDFEELDVSASQ